MNSDTFTELPNARHYILGEQQDSILPSDFHHPTPPGLDNMRLEAFSSDAAKFVPKNGSSRIKLNKNLHMIYSLKTYKVENSPNEKVNDFRTNTGNDMLLNPFLIK